MKNPRVMWVIEEMNDHGTWFWTTGVYERRSEALGEMKRWYTGEDIKSRVVKYAPASVSAQDKTKAK